MLPTYRQLKLQLWWILSDPSESHDRYLKEYRAFFSEQAPLLDVDATFSFGEVCCKQSRNRYEESIYQVDCAIEWPGITWFGPCAKHLQLGHAWCNAGRDQGSNKALFQWLVLSPLEAFQLATRPLDWNVSLLSFSFGTLAELGTYVQHHQFSTYLYRGHPNYWVDSTFQHDQCSLHIDLHLNHRSGCEDHVAERRFVVPYLNVLKVLINEKRFIELYLHLKIPPMLMGKVVSDIPARPGSAAAAAPLCLERYLAIGCNCIGGAVRMASLCGGLFLKLVVRDHSLARHVRGRLSQRFAHGTLICYAPVWTYSSQDAWSLEDQVRCEVQRTLQFPCAFAFKANLYTAFDVLDQMVLMSGSEFNKLVREIETRSEKEPLVVSSIDAGNVVVFSRAFYAACSLFHDKPPQLARGTCLVPSTQHLCYTRPAHLSPCAGPLREQEFAIRMSFRDDNLDKLSFTLNLHSSLDALLDAVVGSFLRQGVYDVMKLTDCPSAMQIRYAGSKGMLCLNPALPNKKLLGLWPSMLKFPCTSSEYLDVVKVSASRSVTLNLPLITILEHLGVRTDTFIRLQENIQFTDALVEESSAVNVLAVWSKLPLLYEDLSMAGFRLALDPFFRSLLLAVYRNAVGK
ncbi:hypothetical protein HPB49_005939 [Dermacentor silvarum]|uniref:Uncharacterized protein n=1 Tax=Dermacentor silvarum TaxID=543639 RepID=A0ACB8DVM3_DERSI|nr:hypothetical protein HPB49_005939 [Dermacentor silvarum]